MAKDTKKQSGSGQRSKARIAEANAKTANANAEAAKAQADAERIKAEVESKRLAAQGDKQKFDTAITAATYAGGVAAGYAISSGVSKKIEASRAAQNAALKSLADETTKLAAAAGGDTPAGKRATAQLAATVKTADKVGITRPGRGKAGLITVVGLAGMGLATRSFGQSQDDPTSKTLYSAVGTAEIVAAGTVAYNEAKAASAPKTLPDVKSLAAIEQGRALAKPGTPAAPEAPAPAKQSAAKAPAQPGAKKAKAASKKMVSGMTKAGGEVVESTAKSAGKTVAKAGLRALGPVAIAAAAIAAVTGSAQAGESTGQNIASGVVAAADAATFGIPGMVADSVKNRETIKYDAKEAARQANAASAEKKLASGAKLTRAEKVAMEKKTKAEEPYGVAERGIDAVQGAMGLTLGALMIKEASGMMRPGFVGRVMLRAGGALAMAAGGALLAKAAASPSKAADGKAYLNDAAKTKAANAPAVSPAAAGRLAAQAMTADGQTEAYQRRTKSGKTVTVQGYRTPTR